MGARSVTVIGGGISGLTAAFRALERDPGVELVLLEAGDVAGGTARSDTVDGYTVDWGPNGFLTNVPQTLDLAAAVGLGDRLQAASAAVNRRYLLKEGALEALPGSPLAFARTGLLPLSAKARVLGEPFASPRDAEIDETVFEFAERRLGRRFAESFIAPMVMGITAGDAREISFDALFPRMRAMEVEHGSLVRAMFARMREARARKGASDGPAGPFGRLTSFGAGGMQALCDAIAGRLGARVRLGARASTLERRGDRWIVGVEGGEVVEAEGIILATPAQVSAGLVEPHAPEAAALMRSIPYVGVRVLGLGYDLKGVSRSLDGFGFLAPPGNGARLLGCVWTSSIFPDQAPQGKALLRIIAGGAFDPEIVDMDDDEALGAVRADLSRIMGLEASPEMVRQIRWARAIPQYTRGHLDRVRQIEGLLGELPQIALTGNAFHGVSLNDCVKDGGRAAASLLDA